MEQPVGASLVPAGALSQIQAGFATQNAPTQSALRSLGAQAIVPPTLKSRATTAFK